MEEKTSAQFTNEWLQNMAKEKDWIVMNERERTSEKEWMRNTWKRKNEKQEKKWDKTNGKERTNERNNLSMIQLRLMKATTRVTKNGSKFSWNN